MELFRFEILQSLFNALGWTLLHFLWQGTVVAIFTRIILILLRKHSSNVRYLAACASLALMLVCAIITFWQFNQSEYFRSFDESGLIQIQPAPLSTETDYSQERHKDVLFVENEMPQNKESYLSQKVETALPWIVNFWLLGVLFLSARLVKDLFFVHKLKRSESNKLDAWHPLFESLSHRLKIKKSVQFLESSVVKVPLVVGWIKPMLLLPIGASVSLTPQQLENIIAHELAHIRRHDYLINILQTVVETLLFYHPAVLWISKQIRIEREYACDDLAIAVCGGNAVNYARALTKVEKMRRSISPSLATAADGGDLKSRVRRLVDKSYRPSTTGFAGGVFIFPAIFVISIVTWQSTVSAKFANNFGTVETKAFSQNMEKLVDEKIGNNENASREIASERFSDEDMFLRQTALSALKEHQGSVIIMNPQTGRLYTIVNQDWALRTEWNPASTFKLVTSVAALEENKIKADEKITLHESPERLNLIEAIGVSRNEYFTRLGARVAADNLLIYAREFGLGRLTGINIEGEKTGFLPDIKSKIDSSKLGMTGQEVKITPLQLAVLVSALANKGTIVTPHTGESIDKQISSRSLKVSPHTISKVVKGMQAAVENGTGRNAFNPSFPIAGKTGTSKGDKNDIGLFASFAPIENPQFVVVVAIKEPEANGLLAAEIAGRIYKAIGSRGYNPEKP